MEASKGAQIRPNSNHFGGNNDQRVIPAVPIIKTTQKPVFLLFLCK